jgi:hypothetical protein
MSYQFNANQFSGLGFNYKRYYEWNTMFQRAVSNKRSSLVLAQYPLIHVEFEYNILHDDVVPSEVQTLMGLFNNLRGRYDTLLMTDPDFNTVTSMQFATGDGGTQSFQLTATYAPTTGAYAGVGAAEIVQNLNGTPTITLTNWEGTFTLVTGGGFTNYIPTSQLFLGNWSATFLGSFATSAVISPDGTADASSFVVSGAGNAFGLTPNIAATNGQTWTFGIWMKCASGTQSIQLYINDNLGNLIDTGVTVTTTWQLFAVTANTRSGTTDIQGAIGATFTGALTFSVFGPSVILGSSIPRTVKTPVAPLANNIGIGATGLISTNWIPWPNDILKWSGSFYYRMGFDDDALGDMTKFMNEWWNNKIKMTSVIL